MDELYVVEDVKDSSSEFLTSQVTQFRLSGSTGSSRHSFAFLPGKVSAELQSERLRQLKYLLSVSERGTRVNVLLIMFHEIFRLKKTTL